MSRVHPERTESWYSTFNVILAAALRMGQRKNAGSMLLDFPEESFDEFCKRAELDATAATDRIHRKQLVNEEHLSDLLRAGGSFVRLIVERPHLISTRDDLEKMTFDAHLAALQIAFAAFNETNPKSQ